jgi:serine protease Do
MSRNSTVSLIAVGLVLFLLGGVGIGYLLRSGGEAIKTVEPGSVADGHASGDTGSSGMHIPIALRATDGGFADVAERIAPAVVNISSERIVMTRRRVPTPFGWDPFYEFFGRRRKSRPQHERKTSLGSGVIVSADGIILTANHVVEGASEIQATLADGRRVSATLLGTDPATDVAVLRIAEDDLPFVPLGNSDLARIGEVVLAFGNPFGIGQTVTMGIVSATGRSDVGLVDYENFIQTDAAINPGNSGGALVDASGNLIGINTAIFSKSGGYQGIGFAVPINIARSVLDGVLATGAITRGWVGISEQDLDAAIVDAFGLPDNCGALINEVLSDSPAERAGLERGDVVVQIQGQPVTDALDLRRSIALAPVGVDIDIEVIRAGSEQVFAVRVEPYEREFTYAAEEGLIVSPLEGIVVEEIDRRTAGRLGLKPQTHGVVIREILARSPAVNSGLRPGDAILEINREKVDGVAKFRRLLSELEGQSVVLLLSRRGALYYLSLPG